MKYLAICIPNYNRLDKLKRLIEECASQVEKNELFEEVEICISDDCSPEDPSELIAQLREKYSEVSFCYVRNEKNRGMDYNFLKSVLISDSLYCWIIGNDDLPEKNSIGQIVEYLKNKNEKIDFLITPFDVYGDTDGYRYTIYPYGKKQETGLIYDTHQLNEYEELVKDVHHNSALFGFLSNVILKRKYWQKYELRFQDKLNTIFIQMYMNIQTLQDGALVECVPWKIIQNYIDDETTVERIADIAIGLDGVIEYFYEGEEKEHLKRVIVDEYIGGMLWDIPEEKERKKKIKLIDSPKNRIYKKYFISVSDRKEFFDGKRVLIYGAGNYGKKVYKELKNYNVVLEGIVDSNESKKGSPFEEFEIMSISDMVDLYGTKEIYVLVACHLGMEDMIQVLKENGITRIGIIS